jgi:hypothetical protein
LERLRGERDAFSGLAAWADEPFDIFRRGARHTSIQSLRFAPSRAISVLCGAALLGPRPPHRSEKPR